MIGGVVLRLIGLVLDAVWFVLPTTTLSISVDPSSWIDDGHGVIGWMDSVMPITEMVTGLAFVFFVYLPVKMTYQTVEWIYRHIPVVGAG